MKLKSLLLVLKDGTSSSSSFRFFFSFSAGHFLSFSLFAAVCSCDLNNYTVMGILIDLVCRRRKTQRMCALLSYDASEGEICRIHDHVFPSQIMFIYFKLLLSKDSITQFIKNKFLFLKKAAS